MRPFNLNIPEHLRNALTDEQFKIHARHDGGDGPAELLIMDGIGDDGWGGGVPATDVVAFLAQHSDKEVNVRINSPGGLVYDGMVIYNALANHGPQVTVTIEGLAFSAASFIAMAGDRVRMMDPSDFGIHRASGLVLGNQKAMRSVADWLNTIDEHLIDIYENKTGQSREQITEWLDGTDDGTLFSANEAFAAGFADEVVPMKKREPAESNAATRQTISNFKNRIRRRRLEALRK